MVSSPENAAGQCVLSLMMPRRQYGGTPLLVEYCVPPGGARFRMPKTKAEKAAVAASVSERLRRMTGAVVADCSRVSTKELEPFRRDARAQDCEYLVVKKTLFRRAADAAGVAVDDALLDGSIGVLFGFSDPVSPAALVKKFVKDHELVQLRGGLLREDGGVRTLVAAEVVRLGGMPSRQELRAKLVGTIANPVRGFVSVLQGSIRNIVYVLSAVQKAKA